MTRPIITVEGLSKQYFIGHQSRRGQGYLTFRETLSREIKNFTRKAADLAQGRQIVQGDEVEEFWALRDINFEIRSGEVVGIIGRNGAGKSTLLKILSRITEPTAGRVALRGRVASLLEVGTGFHSELTGRENIFLNGAILGMTRREIRQKFDEIVEFSGVERFLDTPVKRYSSGMYVRLAFAVAAHLEPEILVVDEVLAVGDAEFQKKCLGKMRDVSRQEGRTVLFVSHNLAAVADLTSRAIVLSGGKVLADAPVNEAISAYLSQASNAQIYENASKMPSSSPHLKRVEVITSEANGIHQFSRELEVRFLISHLSPMSKACFSFNIINQFQNAIVHAWAFPPEVVYGVEPGESLLVCRFPALKLNVGHYHLRTHLTEPPGGEIYEKLDGLCAFEVIRIDDNRLWGWDPSGCAYFEDHSWTVERIEGSLGLLGKRGSENWESDDAQLRGRVNCSSKPGSGA
jgi:lipopolysaccharide transport system ATP-binding protein